MSAQIVMQQMLIIFILMMTGYILYKRGVIRDHATREISALVVNVCNPAILIRSSFHRDPSITYDKLLLAALAGLLMYVLLLGAAELLPRILKVEKRWKNHYALMCLFGNTGFIGIPLASAVLGEGCLIYVAIINAYYNLLFYTYGIRLAQKEGGKFDWKNFLNVGNFSIIVTMVIFFTQPALPAVVTSAVDYMADTTTFLAMLVIGISLAKSRLKEIFAQKTMYLFILLRFVLVPVCISLVLRLFVHDEIIYGVVVLMTCVPIGNLPLMRVEETGGDGRVLSCGIILSTVLSVLTIPVVVALV